MGLHILKRINKEIKNKFKNKKVLKGVLKKKKKPPHTTTTNLHQQKVPQEDCPQDHTSKGQVKSKNQGKNSLKLAPGDQKLIFRLLPVREVRKGRKKKGNRKEREKETFMFGQMIVKIFETHLGDSFENLYLLLLSLC